MANVHWIKIYTNMVSNKKIKRIRTLPEGNSIILIWVFLLAQAGESNKNGALYLTDTIPFRAEDLAVEFDFEVSVIRLAIMTLQRFSMIEVFEEIIYIKNWEEYQNVEGLEKIRNQTALRVARHRANKQLSLNGGEDVTQCNVTVTQDVTQCNATDIELDKDKDTIVILSPDEVAFMSILESVKDYPVDRGKDLVMYKTLQSRYPTLNLIDALNAWATYKLDVPLKPNSKARSQINTSFDNCVKWGKHLKKHQEFGRVGVQPNTEKLIRRDDM